jgi:nucleotide-binding universal stress UspA family protein
MYQRILVPVDGSRFSEQILPHVRWISSKTGVAVALLRVVDKDSERAPAQSALEALGADVPAASICVASGGDVARAILDEAARVPGTLVAMTSHGRSGVMQAILGSTASKVLRTGREPIFVFRPRHADASSGAAPIERIVVPLDGSALSESILSPAAALARWIGARVVVASVLDPAAREADPGVPSSDVMESNYVRSHATKLSGRDGLEIGWEVLHGDAKEAIPSFVRSLPNTMLAMTTHGRSALQSALVGSVTAASLRDGGVPVFTRLA